MRKRTGNAGRGSRNALSQFTCVADSTHLLLYPLQYHVTAATTSIFVSTLSWLQAAKMVVYR